MNEHSEELSEAEAHQARVVRSLRRAAALVGIPLTLALVLPWKMGYSGTKFAWDIAERYDHVGFVLLPMCGVLFLAAAFARRWRYETRARVVGFAGVSVCGLGLILMHLPAFRELDRMWVYAPYVLFLTPIFAVAAEMSMHMRPRSKALTMFALAGWIAMFGVYCTPLEGNAEFESSMMGQTLRALDRGRGDSVIMMLIMLWLWGLSFAGASQAMRRLGEDRDEAASKRFRTSWLGYLLFPVPMVVAASFAMVGQLDDLDDLLEIFVPFACAFGFMFGTALGLCHLFVLSSDSPIVRANLKRATLGVAVAIAAIVIFRVLMPDRRDAHVAELQWAMAEALCDALEGRAVDPRYLGGYAEFDLRSASSLLDVPEGTTFEPELFALSVTGNGTTARAVAFGTDELRWASGGEWASAHPDLYRRASPVLLEAMSRVADASSATGCLPGVSEADVEGMPPLAARLADDPSSICSSNDYGGGGRRFGDTRGGGVSGGVGNYLAVVRGSNGERYVLTGTNRFDSGRLWIGNPTLPDG